MMFEFKNWNTACRHTVTDVIETLIGDILCDYWNGRRKRGQNVKPSGLQSGEVE